LKDGRRYAAATDAPQLMQGDKAARCCPSHVGLHLYMAGGTDSLKWQCIAAIITTSSLWIH